MPNLFSYPYRGKLFRVGLTATVNRYGAEAGFAERGERVKISVLKKDGDEVLIGISGERHGSWHNLDGNVADKCGYWLRSQEAYDYLTIDATVDKYIKCDLKFKGKNLKGMDCKILTSLQDAFIVEFDENIGGISCDGLGKRGHCLPVSPSVLGNRSEKKDESVAEERSRPRNPEKKDFGEMLKEMAKMKQEEEHDVFDDLIGDPEDDIPF